METELLAQAVEEISIVASNMQRKKPVKIPRPDHIKRAAKRGKPGKPGEADVVSMEGYKRAVGVLADSRRVT